MTPEQKMDSILAQVRAADDGRTNVITCPYCGGRNTEYVDFCCELFAEASVAALTRIRSEQAIAAAKRAVERHLVN